MNMKRAMRITSHTVDSYLVRQALIFFFVQIMILLRVFMVIRC